MTALMLNSAAERAVRVLVADLSDGEVFGALADGCEDGQDGHDQDQQYVTSVAFTGVEATITLAPRGA
ncbi:hypothetical protein EDD99_3633 [Streptomyces sp. 846.5]|nr:hypothetical protein [Streptomyces sp. 846.5]TDU05132.1 hypothetical protein EDD99_3633 [Streptomyces sp. 846.5]